MALPDQEDFHTSNIIANNLIDIEEPAVSLTILQKQKKPLAAARRTPEPEAQCARKTPARSGQISSQETRIETQSPEPGGASLVALLRALI